MKPNLEISDDPYLRERLEPSPGDWLYLHLSDLRIALEEHRNKTPVRVLDFGCGGSPYRRLFPGEPYHRADFTGFTGLDFTFGEDSKLAAPSASYDLILSTQVLEHVRDPGGYLQECRRLLAPGGRLLLTTHGTFWDHGCPYDFQRWTADGLRELIGRHGFKVTTVNKLTTGPRAALFVLRQHRDELLTSEKSWGGICLRLIRQPLRMKFSTWDRFLDRQFASRRVVPAVPGSDPFYIALLVVAERTD